MGRRLALLIATYLYQDTGLRQLTAPAHDVEALAGVLADPGIAEFEVTTLINEPHHRVGEAIGDFYHNRKRDDLTLLYFTGHGLKDDDGRLYLAMTNTRRESLLFTALSGEQIDHAMEACASQRKVLVLDCCYSGAFPAGRAAKADAEVHALERFQGKGRTVLTASDATQYSFEGDQLLVGDAVQSVFTRHLVAGLRDGSADLDGDGDITLDELYSYAHDRVVEEIPSQRPKKQDNVQGRTVIARNINWTMPRYVVHALNSPIAADRLNALDALDHLHRIGNAVVRGRVLEEISRLTDDDSRSVSTAAAGRLALLQEKPAGRQSATTTPAQRPKPPASLAQESPPAEEKPEAAAPPEAEWPKEAPLEAEWPKAQPAFTWPEPAQSPGHPSRSKPGGVEPGESVPEESLPGESQSVESQSGRSVSDQPRSAQSPSDRPKPGHSQSAQPQSGQSQPGRPQRGRSRSDASGESQSGQPQSGRSSQPGPWYGGEPRQGDSTPPRGFPAQPGAGRNSPESAGPRPKTATGTDFVIGATMLLALTSFGLVLADVGILFVGLVGVLTIVLVVVAWIRS
jgi:hypothetical protein